MARKEVKYNLQSLIKKAQLGQSLTIEEEVFYLVKGLGINKKEVERMVYIATHQRPVF